MAAPNAFVWTTADGQKLRPSEMGDYHLINTMVYLYRHMDDADYHREVINWKTIQQLAIEADARGLLPYGTAEQPLRIWLDTKVAEQDYARQRKYSTVNDGGGGTYQPKPKLKAAAVKVQTSPPPAGLSRKLDFD